MRSSLLSFFFKELVKTCTEDCPKPPPSWPRDSLLSLPIASYCSINCANSDTEQLLELLPDFALQALVLGRDVNLSTASRSLLHPLLTLSWTGGEGEELQQRILIIWFWFFRHQGFPSFNEISSGFLRPPRLLRLKWDILWFFRHQVFSVSMRGPGFFSHPGLLSFNVATLQIPYFAPVMCNKVGTVLNQKCR